MDKKILLIIGLIVIGILILVFYAISNNIALLNPKGIIALQERNIIYLDVFLMFLVVIPMFIIALLIAHKYKEDSKKAKYVPDWKNSKLLVLVWWTVPAVLVLVLAVINWKNTHALDPFAPLESNVKSLTIQVIALRWKWLFIYPEQNIATVNYIQFPVDTPINFELSSDDAPMNSFWIPQLGGQMYAMTGMGTKLHLIANTIGDFSGSAAEINGAGFSGMRFVARSSSNEDFERWVEKVHKSSKTLDADEYDMLSKPSENNPVVFYSSTVPGLYNKIIMKYMTK
jgi:cytochrome o ubiquinol oxidase subunit 2